MGLPTATVRLRGGDGVLRVRAAVGSGPIDAACKAIEQALDMEVTLVDYVVHAVTPGLDALGEVSVRVRGADGRVVHGRGADTDVIVASARAYLAAVTRLAARAGGGMRTLFEKVWDAHVVAEEPESPAVLHIDLHLVHEVTSPQAFSELAARGLRVRRPDLTLATMDHSTPTTPAGGDGRRRLRAARAAAPELRRARRHALRARLGAAGHRPRHRAGARPHPPGDDGGLRRQPHLDARRLRGAGFRYRHQRGGGRSSHPSVCSPGARAPLEVRIDGRLGPRRDWRKT
jgi:hypothetical protein